MTKLTLALSPFIAALFLSGCGAETPPNAEPQANAADQAQAAPETVIAVEVEPPPLAAPRGGPSVTLQELMSDIIEPNAQRVWRAVSYTATENGIEETMPVHDMDWEGLHQSAITLIEAAHGLTLEGREVGGDAYEAIREDFQYTAEEITALRARNLDDWNEIAAGMEELTRETLAAIERRDILGLTETSAAINQACEICHAEYWYRPQRPAF
ncbi:MAG: hypothetical protein LBE21_09260 [Pseudomonadales bacterium]|jgi:hypothetical protein|nr:hypothetical protein [Pseudomonadales bacterium]